MPLIIDYSSFLNPSEIWAGDNIDPPNQPYLYKPIATGISSDDRTIIFSNLPAGMEVLNAPQTTAPYDSVFFDIEGGGYLDYILLKDNFDGSWAALTLDLEASTLSAAYTSGGYWAFGDPDGGSPGCILTGAGNINTSIADISWYGIDPSDDDNPAPSPFNTVFAVGYSWNETIPNEIMTSYDVISPSGIQIRATGAGGTPFNDIQSALRNLCVLFSVPS
jgi:hypothetical protein